MILCTRHITYPKVYNSLLQKNGIEHFTPEQKKEMIPYLSSKIYTGPHIDKLTEEQHNLILDKLEDLLPDMADVLVEILLKFKTADKDFDEKVHVPVLLEYIRSEGQDVQVRIFSNIFEKGSKAFSSFAVEAIKKAVNEEFQNDNPQLVSQFEKFS